MTQQDLTAAHGDLSAQQGSAQAGAYDTHRPRLSVRARLTLGALAAALPLLAVATWLAWDTPLLWQVWTVGLLSLALGLGLISWAYRPLSSLTERARRLAGIEPGNQRLLGLIRTDPPGDEVLSLALDEIEQSLQQIRALNRIGQFVASDEDLSRILSVIAEEAVALLHADAGIIGVWDAGHEVFRDVAACNMPIMFPGREFGARDSLSSQVARSAELTFVEDYQTYPYRIPEVERFQLRAALGVPMMAGGVCVGSLCVHTVDPGRQFTEREGELLLAFASQAGAAFEKARLYQTALDRLEDLTRAREQLARESKDLERALSNMVGVQEAERSRIAADVHDGVVQMMVGSLCELQAAMAHFPAEPKLVDAKQEKARDLIRDSITELRRVIFDLRPITLDTAGLVPAIENLVADLQEITDVQLDLYVGGTPCRFSSDVEIGTYRIIQEALNNAVKHAGAHLVEIDTRFADGVLHIAVRDDGRGFSVGDTPPDYTKSAGLIGMTERARSLGGWLTVSSAPKQGTTVAAEIPCRPRKRPVQRHAPIQVDSIAALSPDPVQAREDGPLQ